MINILASCFLVSFILISYGSLLLKFIYKKKNEKDNHFEFGLFGIIFLSFISLLFNFFIPINIYFNNVILIIGVVYAALYIKINKKLIYSILLSSLFSSLLLLLNNVNRPDAGLYHLPYINILNDHKIIIGLSNLHLRFAHISIIQYVSAIFKNSILGANGILIPLAFCGSFFILYLTNKLIDKLKNNKTDISLNVLLFLILIFSFYSLSNYSEYGNDVPAYIYFFYSIVIFLDKDAITKFSAENYNKILILSIFTILNKIFFIFILIIPIIVFIYNQKIIYNNKLKFIIPLFLIVAWFVKNVLISGCFIYPSNISCIKNLQWYNPIETQNARISGEAWAKGWVDQKEPKIKEEEFNKNFNWIKTWSQKHLKKINEKFTPFIVFNILFVIFLIYPFKPYNKIKNPSNLLKKRNYKIIIIFTISIIGSAFWFIKFPLYRYGAAYLACLVSAASTIIISYYIKRKINPIILKNIIFLSMLLFIFVNIKRVTTNYKNYYYNYPWPKIYSFSADNKVEKKIPVFNNEKIIYYISDAECMYGYSPCTGSNNKINYKEIFSYKVFY